MRQLVVDLPDFGDADLNARADHLITSLARGIATLISSTAKTDGES
jgi:hypothetical protein